MELQRASLPGRHRGNVLLEQEKQRTLALQREELASFHKLQTQHRQEQQRWERERERHRQQVEANEARLRLREEECRRLEVTSALLALGASRTNCCEMQKMCVEGRSSGPSGSVATAQASLVHL